METDFQNENPVTDTPPALEIPFVQWAPPILSVFLLTETKGGLSNDIESNAGGFLS